MKSGILLTRDEIIPFGSYIDSQRRTAIAGQIKLFNAMEAEGLIKHGRRCDKKLAKIRQTLGMVGE